jgi:CDP-glycerol glycerophosphotransferase
MIASLPIGSPSTATTIDAITVEGGSSPRVVISGTGRPVGAVLRGPRQDLSGTVAEAGGRFTATFSLLVSRWSGPVLPAPSGSYSLTIDAAVTAPLPSPVLADGLLRAEVVAGGSSLRVEVSPPLADDELGAEAQAALEARYRSTKPEPINAVFFESFYGQSAT